MLENIEVLNHSCIKICKNKIIYIDPYKINKDYNDADLIFITHDHFDHFSESDIEKIKNEDTTIIITSSLKKQVNKLNFKEENIIIVKPNQTGIVKNIKYETIPAYNISKKFHPKENGWVGYILTINEKRYYISGDTDITEESKQVNCDVAFVPVGGTYTMTSEEAAELVNIIKPKIAVPIHYGSIVGTKHDALAFIEILNKEIEGKILMK